VDYSLLLSGEYKWEAVGGYSKPIPGYEGPESAHRPGSLQSSDQDRGALGAPEVENTPASTEKDKLMTSINRMPVLFIGHGSPMNAIEDNEYSRTWKDLGKTLPTPKAVLCISAHWETRGTGVTAMARPRTIHDFYGFPRELNEMQYPAPGSSELVDLVKKSVKSIEVTEDQEWGFDHGSWSVLCCMYPDASIPVVQLSLNRDLPEEFHYALGRELEPLREEGILILGSGNMVHNLRLASYEGGSYDWATAFDASLKKWILAGEHEQVVHYERYGKPAELSVNSAEHYLPLLYVLGASVKDDEVEFYNEQVMMGSISMRSVKLG